MTDAQRFREMVHSRLPGALDVRLDSRATQRELGITLRGVRQFCMATA